MKATKLPSGKYMATAYLGKDDDGKQVRKSFTAPTAKQAVALAMDFEQKHKVISDQGSLKVAMQRFLKDKERTLSPSTIRDYTSRYRTLCASYTALCAKHIQTITERDLNDLVSDMTTSHAPRHRMNKQPLALSPKTIKNYIRFLSAVFRHAGVPMPRVDLPEKTMPDIYVPTDAEMKTLLSFLSSSKQYRPLYVPVLLAAFGPLRRGEICALDFDRDIQENVIHVREALAYGADGEIHRKNPKTFTSNRFIEMPTFVIEAIHEQGYVTDLTPNSITRRFENAVRASGLPRFRFHDLRHYCVSTLHAQGVADAYIMQRGGWSTDNVLKKVYRHTLADQQKIFSDRAIAHFDSVFH